jgi:Methylamine utilisation protein MauE
MIDPAVGALVVGCFALLFASAALHKLRSPAQFAAILRAYRVLPAGALRGAWLVPWLELGVAAGLLAAATRLLAAAAAAGLLVCYAGAIALNLARGRRELACGCGGPDDERPIAPWMVARNLTLALLVAISAGAWRARPMLPTDAVTVGAGIAAASLLYMSLDRLLGRVAPRTAALRGPR